MPFGFFRRCQFWPCIFLTVKTGPIFFYCFWLVYTTHKNVRLTPVLGWLYKLCVCVSRNTSNNKNKLARILNNFMLNWFIECPFPFIIHNNTSSASNSHHMGLKSQKKRKKKEGLMFSIRFTFKLSDLALMWWDAIRDHLGLCPFLRVSLYFFFSLLYWSLVILVVVVEPILYFDADLRGIQHLLGSTSTYD